MPNVIRTCAKCRLRYEYFFDGQNFLPCPNCGDDPIGSLERARTTDLIAQLYSSDSTTRHNAAVMLGERRVQEAAEPLLAMLSKKGAAKLELGAIIALGRLREERAVEKLISLLFEGRDWRKDQQTRRYPKTTEKGAGWIVEALAQIGTDRALAAVYKIAGDTGVSSGC
jgi:predicted RNA-binding Zn-ribbon protein involved in translation (DUF1610 family)